MELRIGVSLKSGVGISSADRLQCICMRILPSLEVRIVGCGIEGWCESEPEDWREAETGVV